MTPIDRRMLLALVGAGAATAGCASVGDAPFFGPFRHGVASGDPGTDSVVLWTRITTTAPRARVAWQVSLDTDFTEVVASGTVLTDASRDFTVHALPSRLPIGGLFYYRFTTEGQTSPVGRTRTLPEGRVERLGIALMSCSNFAFGHFNAYEAIAADPEIDLLLHTGDYLYEYGANEWGGEISRVLGRMHMPAHETLTLADYRLRHAQYRGDPGAMAMSAAHPLVVMWDDHEVTNNPWTGGAQNHTAGQEGRWTERRRDAVRAFHEWMPIRDPRDDARRLKLWRSYQWGDLATLATFETRHTGRDQQVDYADWFARIDSPDARDRFMAEVIGDPSRRMIEAEQEGWLEDVLRRSVEADTPWRVLGSASPLARMLVPDLIGGGMDPGAHRTPQALGTSPDLVWTGRWSLPWYTDTWDGYPAARERFYALWERAGARDVLVLTGDTHSFWMNTLANARGRRVGLEIGTAGITSPGDFIETGWSEDGARIIDQLFAHSLPEVEWTDSLHQGYVRVVLERDGGRADFVAVETLLVRDPRTRVLRSTRIVRDGDTLAYA
jgi:phosphodiesterase/alkaline phosphatase D-like protein